jgi:hypothetical protein
MKRLSACFAGLILLLAAVSESRAALVASATDLWDVSQGTIVTSNSGVISSSHIGNMFGFVSGFPIDWTVNTLFRDGQPTGTLHLSPPFRSLSALQPARIAPPKLPKAT